MRHIVRIDVEKPTNQHCWEVKIRRASGMFHRTFSDSKHGGKAGALEAAQSCRDAEVKARPALNAFERAVRPRRTNRSGIVGVRYGAKIVRRGDKVWSYPAWIATGTPVSGGRTKTKYFTLSTYGDSSKRAKEAAIQQRATWERQLKASVESQEGTK